MPSFPGPQKNKMEAFIHHLYEGKRDGRLSKQEMMPKVRDFEFAPDVQVFFEELPEREYDEDGLIAALNDVIKQRGRTEAMGGTLERREQIPQEWEQAYQEMVRKG